MELIHLRDKNRSFLIITHYQRLLDYIKPDFVHVLVNGKIVKTGCSDLAQELEKDGYEGVSHSKMNLKFEEFKKSNLGFKELDNIRIKSFKKFETEGFPTKKQEHWKYTDLKNII